MKKSIITLLILFLSASFVYADNQDNKDKCKALFEELYEYSIRKNISDNDFKKCRHLVKQLNAQNYYAHKIEKDGKPFIDHFLTPTYGDICLKTNPDLGIPAYIGYLIDHKNSASELLSFSFEPIFKLHPEMVLDEIRKLDKATQDYLLDRFYWGFLNNNPVKKEEVINGRTEIKKYPMDATNYEEVFYKAYPALADKYEKYKISIDYIFECCSLYFKWAEERRKKVRAEKKI